MKTKILILILLCGFASCKKNDPQPQTSQAQHWDIAIDITGIGTYTVQFGSNITSGKVINSKHLAGTCYVGGLYKLTVKPDSTYKFNMVIKQTESASDKNIVNSEDCNGCGGMSKQY